MKLSDVMSAMGLSAYAEVALLLFIGAFIGVSLELLLSGKRREALRYLPLDDGEPRTKEGS
jgi:hypothetical protein